MNFWEAKTQRKQESKRVMNTTKELQAIKTPLTKHQGVSQIRQTDCLEVQIRKEPAAENQKNTIWG